MDNPNVQEGVVEKKGKHTSSGVRKSTKITLTIFSILALLASCALVFIIAVAGSLLGIGIWLAMLICSTIGIFLIWRFPNEKKGKTGKILLIIQIILPIGILLFLMLYGYSLM